MRWVGLPVIVKTPAEKEPVLIVNGAVAANCELVEIERLRGRECGGSGSHVRIGNVFVEKECLRREPDSWNPVSRESGARAVRRRQRVVDGVQPAALKSPCFMAGVGTISLKTSPCRWRIPS